jgi:presenilin-like A22 family membrane protease
MKHTTSITLILVCVFFLSQVIGLAIVDQYIDHDASVQNQETSWRQLPFDMERPPIENQSSSFIPLFIAILLGTGLVLLLIKFNLSFILKAWFFLVIIITLVFGFSAFLNQAYALILAVIFAIWKMHRPNIIIHNLSELFIYGGLAAIFVPLLNVVGASMLLFLISVYDMIAVWHTKHMVKMATFQTNEKIFAGLFIPYGNQDPIAHKGQLHSKMHSLSKKKADEDHVERKIPVRVAVLGGGDMGFPLIFSGVVMKEAMLTEPHLTAFLTVLIIPLCAAIALHLLLMHGQKEKFYPAMPFISIGCSMGYVAFLALI